MRAMEAMGKGMGGGGHERGGTIHSMLVPGSVGCLHVTSGITGRADTDPFSIPYLSSSDTLAQNLPPCSQGDHTQNQCSQRRYLKSRTYTWIAAR
ncbi:hypothetical protein SCLCIDRAFT_551188 [Scleroderma citrinum Foug A]|uniref:Uncharacterized protein n=1 Tax=Scleroderma citrinum Foug A TaxID=1036808 RepID=A0A0C3D8U2_9AGAM|nr:hypothetical protein SCLCIDRAFT_551188 [Scleroderma citrinum Foug A]